MPILGVGLLKKGPREYLECSDFHLKKQMEKIERIFTNAGYVKKYPFGARTGSIETYYYVKIKDGVLLRRIEIFIEYCDDTSQIPYKIKMEPLCGNDLTRWREEEMERINVLYPILEKVGYFCVYYCSHEVLFDNVFYTNAERKNI